MRRNRLAAPWWWSPTRGTSLRAPRGLFPPATVRSREMSESNRLGGVVGVFSRAEPVIRTPRVKPRRLGGFWVTAREAFGIDIEALRAHKLRSFLTLLGVVTATTTLIVVISVINGMNI